MRKYFRADLFTDCPDTLPSDASLNSIADDFKKGIFNRRKQFIECFCKTAIAIAVNLCGTDDCVGEALEALCGIPQEIHEGKMPKGDDIKKFVKRRIHTRCTRHRRYQNMIVKIPHSSKHLGVEKSDAMTISYNMENKHDGSSMGDLFLADKNVVPVDRNLVTEEIFSKVIITYREKKIVDLILTGYTYAEIGKMLHLDSSHIGALMFTLGLRLKEVLDNEKA